MVTTEILAVMFRKNKFKRKPDYIILLLYNSIQNSYCYFNKILKQISNY